MSADFHFPPAGSNHWSLAGSRKQNVTGTVYVDLPGPKNN